MKKKLILCSIMTLFAIISNGQIKKDGTPDMRYKANKQSYSSTTSPSYSLPKSNNRNYSNSGQYKVQNGYQKRNGTYVSPHLKTKPDDKKWNNAKNSQRQ